jgi:hypothetical protein
MMPEKCWELINREKQTSNCCCIWLVLLFTCLLLLFLKSSNSVKFLNDFVSCPCIMALFGSVLLTTAQAHNSNLLFTCFQQVFGCSSPGDMSTNYRQPTPQMRSREYDAGLWNYRGPLLTVAGYIKGPASGRTISFIDRTIHEAFLSDQLARVHNLRANNSIAPEYTSQNRIKTLWVPIGQHFPNFWVRWTVRWVAIRQQYQTAPPPRRE